MTELEESERRFRMLVESVTDYAIFMLDPSGTIVNWNPGSRSASKAIRTTKSSDRIFPVSIPTRTERTGTPTSHRNCGKHR